VGYGVLCLYVTFYLTREVPSSLGGRSFIENPQLIQELTGLGINSTQFTSTMDTVFEDLWGKNWPITRLHVIGSALWATIPIFQFFPSIRNSYPAVHRWLGVIWMLASYFQAGSGIYLALYSQIPSLTWRASNVVVGFFVITLTTIAWYHAYSKNIKAHQLWVIRAWSLCSFALWFRLVRNILLPVVVVTKHFAMLETVPGYTDLINTIQFGSLGVAFILMEILTSRIQNSKEKSS